MTDLRTSFQDSTLEVVATLRDRHIRTVATAQTQRADIVRAAREAVSLGADISSVSEASGLTVKEIEAAIAR